MITFIYATLAIAFLSLALGFLRKTKPTHLDEPIDEKGYPSTVNNRKWLVLSERIFDPSDVCWLEDELAFPRLAHALALERKRLAIRWLESLQKSFDELIRVPSLATTDHPDVSPAPGWRALWLVFRFKFLVTYALLMVKFFGPYHALIPSFSWLPFTQASPQTLAEPQMASSRGSE